MAAPASAAWWRRVCLDSKPREVALMLNGFGIHPYAVRAWNTAKYRVCADGGVCKIVLQKNMKMPTHVLGDLDSYKCKELGFDLTLPPDVELIHYDNDQDTTDFMKCLKFIEETLGYRDDLVTGFALGGRMDHEQTNLRTAMNATQCRPLLFSDTEFTAPIHPGTTVIPRTHPLKACIGLFPYFGPTNVKTTGLRWNLDGVMGYDAHYLWTSSNEFAEGEDEVTVTCDKPLLFTACMYQDQQPAPLPMPVGVKMTPCSPCTSSGPYGP